MRVNSKLICCLFGVMAIATGCGAGIVAPLDIGLGLSRPETITALKKRAYCRTDDPVRTTERFQRCDGPGAQRALSWVVVEYRDRVAWRVQRLERHESSGQAAERWHGLIAGRRTLHGAPSKIARERLLEIRGLPAGTVSWAAWYSSDFKTLIAVYLLRVTVNDGVDRPDVLEEITADPVEKVGNK